MKVILREPAAMSRFSKREGKSEIFSGKKTQCLNCRKTIRQGRLSWAVRRVWDGKLIARHCSQKCDEEYFIKWSEASGYDMK